MQFQATIQIKPAKTSNVNKKVFDLLRQAVAILKDDGSDETASKLDALIQSAE